MKILTIFFLSLPGLIRHFRPVIEERMEKYAAQKAKQN